MEVLSLRFAFMMLATPTACGIALWRPFWGLLCLVFMYYFRPDIWGAPTWFRPIFWITLCVAIGWATRVRTLRWHPLLTMSVMVLLGFLIAALQAVDDVDKGLDAVIVIGKLMIVQLLVVQLVDTPKKLSQLLWANVFGMLWNVKTVLYLGLSGQGVSEDIRVDVGVGQGGGANYLAMIFVMLLPIVIMKVQNGTRREKTFSLIIFPLLTLCLIFTGSRSGFIAIGCIMLQQLFRSNRKVMGFLAIAVMALLGWWMTPESHWDRFKEGVTPEDEKRDFAAESRLRLWKAGIDMWKERPIVGVGPDNYSMLSPKYSGFYAGRDTDWYVPGLQKAGFVAHNTWIQVLAETGIVGGVPFALMFIMSLTILMRVGRKLPKGWPERRMFYMYAVILEGIILAIMACAIFGSYQKVDFLWWFFGAVSAISLMANDRLAAVAAARRRALLVAHQRAHGATARRPVAEARGS